MIAFHTLDQSLITSIKKMIAATEGRFTFDITDEEVFGEVERRLDEEYQNVGFGRNNNPTWEEAAELSMDDYGCCEALGYF